MNQYQSIKILALALLLSSSACSPKVDHGGYVAENPIKDQVQINKSSREDVRTALGSPSSQSSFGIETWYYISNRKEAVGFLKPEVVKQDVTSIEFDENGVVSAIKSYDKKDSHDVKMVGRVTPTEGHELGFFEQLVGNIGRFNRPRDTSTGAPGHIPGN